MRRMFSVGFAAALALCVAGTASAGTSIDLVLSGSTVTTPNVATITPSFGDVTLSVFMTTDENIEFLSVSVAWDNADTVVSSITEWGNFLVSFSPFVTMAPINTTNTIIGQLVTSFDGVVSPLDSGFGILPGTYQIGTIVFTHSSPWSTTNLNANIFTGIDLFVLSGGVDITGTISLGSATINVVPEPGTASLLGLGLVGLILAGRRKRA